MLDDALKKQVEDLKVLGNKAFTTQRYSEAIDLFSKAIEIDPSNHILFSNRSAAYASQGDYDQALKDAKTTVELAPQWAKSYSRLSSAYFGLNMYSDALEAINKGLSIEPTNKALLDLAKDVEIAQNGPNNNEPLEIQAMFERVLRDPELEAKISSNPTLKHHLNDPNFISALRQAQRDPQNAPNLIASNPALLNVFLSNIGYGQSMPKEEEKEPQVKIEPKNQALQEIMQVKEQGNAAYKAREFEKAIEFYTQALSMFNDSIEDKIQEPSIMLNIAAVYYEMNNYEQCIAKCDEAIERGREKIAGFQFIGKAMARKAKAYEALNQIDLALHWYKLSMTENRTPETLARVNALEKEIKLAEKRAYFSIAKSDEARERGNTFFSKGKYPEAVSEYSEAIKRNETEARAYANRSACYLKLGAVPEALRDAETSIQLEPNYTKGYVRKANALLLKRSYADAIETCEKAQAINVRENLIPLLKKQNSSMSAEEVESTAKSMLEKQQAEIQGLLAKCQSAYIENQRKMRSTDPKERQKLIENAMRDPDIADILRDPAMNAILKSMQEDPRAAQAYMADPMVALKIRKLVDAGIVSTS